MVNVYKAVNYALSQVGYHEKASNAFLDDFTANAGNGNWTKYGALVDSIDWWYNGKKNGYDWCAQFYDAVQIEAYGAKLAQKLLCRPDRSAGAGCSFAAGYYSKAGRFFSEPQVGDQIFFDYGGGINHTGIVVEVNDYAIITVEGNVNGQVMKCSYPHSSSVIAGYGRPCYELYDEEEEEGKEEAPTPETCEVTLTLPVLKYGDISWHVALMQITLIGRGYSCGASGADGDFGMQSKIGLYEFKKANGLDTDHIICDGETWEKLLT